MTHDSDDSDNMIMSLRDWRQALKTPPSYRIGNSTLRIQTKFTIIVLVGIIILFLLYYALSEPSHSVQLHDDNYSLYRNSGVRGNLGAVYQKQYNTTYPLTRPIRTPKGVTFRIGVISDLDIDSRSKIDSNMWVSYLQKGYLMWNPAVNLVSVSWDKKWTELKSSLGQGGRGMELSELIVFNGKLYAMDDRTGVVFEIAGSQVIPWVLLPDGDGRATKGFKSEWATIRNHSLYIGGLGKEWTSSKGDIINFDPQWIKTISFSGEVSHQDWRNNYLALARKAGISYPGYMIHESAAWSDIHQRWFFLPRRCSKEAYHEETDELMGTNILLSCDEHFQDIKVSRVGELQPSHGFSSFKFVPGTGDEVIVAIKSEELKGFVATYIMAFKIDGRILMPETKIGDIKYEGIEFI